MTAVTFTPQARRELAALPNDRRGPVGNAAKIIALGRGSNVAGVEDVRAALLCAGDAFLPEPGEYEEAQ